MEDKLYNRHREFGKNTLKRRARVRRTDSPVRIYRAKLPYPDANEL